MRGRPIILLRASVLSDVSWGLTRRERLAGGLDTVREPLSRVRLDCVLDRREGAEAGRLIGEKLAAILEKAFDVRFDRGQARSLRLRLLAGLLTHGLEDHLQRLQALLQRHQALGEGMDGLGQVLGMAADPEGHRGAGHRSTREMAA